MDESQTWMDLIQRLGVALAIGFLVGVERGWKQRDDREGGRAAGVRTFTLSGLLGGIAGVLLPSAGPILVAAIALAFCTAFAVFEFREGLADQDNSATSTIAGMLVFALGLYAVVGEMQIAAAAAVAATVILAFKQSIHSWLQSLSWKEIRSALLILAATFIALPVLPEEPVDPWGVLSPRTLWLLTILIAAASFGGYVALRVFGERMGLMAGALIGAVVSSTAVTLDLARRVKGEEAALGPSVAAASLAAVVSLVRVAILAMVFSVGVGARVLPALGAAAAVFLAGALILYRRGKAEQKRTQAAMQNPLDVLAVGRFALVLAALTVAANLATKFFGAAGLTIFAATAGLVDVDAVTLAVGREIQSGLAPLAAATAILLAAAANQAFKLAAAAAAGSPRFALSFGVVVAAAFAAGAAAHVLVGSFAVS
jgi:uncharacterized membrane protein (DUF4010 family)